MKQPFCAPSEALRRVLDAAAALPRPETETVPLDEAGGRIAARTLSARMDQPPFDRSPFDGYALHSADAAGASRETPVTLPVTMKLYAGDAPASPLPAGCAARIMTGAPMPDDADSVVKYEIVDVVTGDGKPGSRVAFSAPTAVRSNVREAGEEAKAGETVVSKGEVIGSAGVGFLAGCGIVEVPTHRRPRVAIISIGSELVDPAVVPTPGKIRNSNSYALAACAQAAGAAPVILPIVEDTKEALAAAVSAAADAYDFVVTSGGASNGDFDFIKPVVSELGELLMTTVNIRPGKAQTFGVVRGTPVFGLPGNPAAAYVGFEMIIRPALRKMQGYAHFERPSVMAKLSRDVKKKDPRRIFLRGTLYKNDEGEYVVAPAKNQSSGLFGVIQRSNCMAILPEGLDSRTAGSLVQCVLLDVSEEVSL